MSRRQQRQLQDRQLHACKNLMSQVATWGSSENACGALQHSTPQQPPNHAAITYTGAMGLLIRDIIRLCTKARSTKIDKFLMSAEVLIRFQF